MRSWTVRTLVVVFGLVLAGCGSDGAEVPPEASAAAGRGPRPGAPLTSAESSPRQSLGIVSTGPSCGSLLLILLLSWMGPSPPHEEWRRQRLWEGVIRKRAEHPCHISADPH